MIYITGDAHGDFQKLNTKRFPQQKELTHNDFVIICGDFGGIWLTEPTPEEEHTLKWLNDKPFTTLFCDGNHENFERLKKYPIVSFHGGKAHKIRNNVYHLMRGYVFNFDGKKFFVFGGAKSHDIQDGILDPKDYESKQDLMRSYHLHWMQGHMIRVKGLSWWPDELPKQHEMDRGIRNLEKVEYKVDYIISHCLPFCMAQLLYYDCQPDKLTLYFDKILEHGISFKKWYCGHYHLDRDINEKFRVLYDSMNVIS